VRLPVVWNTRKNPAANPKTQKPVICCVLACRLEQPENPAVHPPSAVFLLPLLYCRLRFGFIFPEHFFSNR
jgi:hypothetical protein